MRRREFLALVGGTAAAWPLVAQAQQDGRVRRIGLLDAGDEADGFLRARWDALRAGLATLGWIEGRNVRFDLRFSAGDSDRRRILADELVRLAPDVIVVTGGPAAQAARRRGPTSAIFFTTVVGHVATSRFRE